MENLYIKGKILKYENKDKEICVFINEMNTSLSLSLLTEKFINIYNGNIFIDNIRFIGVFNPFRKRKRKGKKEICRLSIPDDNESVLKDNTK